MTLERTLSPASAGEVLRSRTTIALVWIAWLGVTGVSTAWTVFFGKDPAAASTGVLGVAKITAVAAAAAVTWLALLYGRGVMRRGRFLLLVVALTPWLITVIRDAYVDPVTLNTGLLYPVLALGIWAGSGTTSALRTVGLQTVLTAVIALALGGLIPNLALQTSQAGEIIASDKSIFGLPGLEGMYGSGNNLGLHLALGLPFVFLLRNRWLRIGGVGISLIVLFLTSSRSAMFAAGVSLVVLLVLSLVRGRAQQVVAVAAMASSAVAVCILPALTTDLTAFSGRQRIWAGSFEAVQDSVWFGLGSRWYPRLLDTTDTIGRDAVEGHNQLVHTLVGGGIVLVLSVVLLYVLSSRRAIESLPRDRGIEVGFLVAILAVSVLEVPLGFLDRTMFTDISSLPLLLILLRANDEPGSDGIRD